MSFKKILLDQALENIPDFTYDAKNSTNTEFEFYKEEGPLKYKVTFQIASQLPMFVVELQVKDNNSTKHSELNRKRDKRLGHLAYGTDYWWKYKSNDEDSITKALEQAFEDYKKHAPNFFSKSSEKILTELI